MIVSNSKYIDLTVLRRLVLFIFILVTIPFVTNTIPFLGLEDVSVSLIVETDLETESSELTDLDDDFYPLFSYMFYTKAKCLLCAHYTKQNTVYLYYDELTPPPENRFI